MIGDLFDSPWKILVVPAVIVLLMVLVFIRMRGGGSLINGEANIDAARSH